MADWLAHTQEETAASVLEAELGYCSDGGIKEQRIHFHRKPIFLWSFMSCRTNYELGMDTVWSIPCSDEIISCNQI